jgi:acyl carrier protein
MELQSFVANFAAQFDDTDVSIFKPDTKFREIEEWSSLTALTVIAMVDEEYNVTLRGEDIQMSKTIEDLYNIVKGKI